MVGGVIILLKTSQVKGGRESRRGYGARRQGTSSFIRHASVSLTLLLTPVNGKTSYGWLAAFARQEANMPVLHVIFELTEANQATEKCLDKY